MGGKGNRGSSWNSWFPSPRSSYNNAKSKGKGGGSYNNSSGDGLFLAQLRQEYDDMQEQRHKTALQDTVSQGVAAAFGLKVRKSKKDDRETEKFGYLKAFSRSLLGKADSDSEESVHDKKDKKKHKKEKKKKREYRSPSSSSRSSSSSTSSTPDWVRRAKKKMKKDKKSRKDRKSDRDDRRPLKKQDEDLPQVMNGLACIPASAKSGDDAPPSDLTVDAKMTLVEQLELNDKLTRDDMAAENWMAKIENEAKQQRLRQLCGANQLTQSGSKSEMLLRIVGKMQHSA